MSVALTDTVAALQDRGSVTVTSGGSKTVSLPLLVKLGR